MAVRRTFTRSAKRHTDWSASAVQTALTVIPASSVVLSQVFTPVGAGETLVRTRGLFAWGSDQLSASENQLGAIGIGVVSAQAASVGVTAVPHPDTDSAWGGWLFHSYYASSFFFSTAASYIANALFSMPVDSKAMRKVGEEERLVVVIANSSTTGVQVYDSFRLLSKPF